jgi:iron complex outermembrane receptor protein
MPTLIPFLIARPAWTGGWLAALAVVAPPVLAQTDSIGAQPPRALEEVVISARKRAENLQDTPISVTAFSAEALLARQVTTIADIDKFTPNLILDSATSLAGSSSTITAFIRGVGQTDFNLTIDPGVGLYLDGVYVSRSVGALLDTADLERVEVLRGPQGTLFGKNTIGGAIVLTSKRPGDEFEATLEGTLGDFDRRDARAMINAPLGERAALRFSASRQEREGYVRRTFDGDKMGDRDALAGRLALELRPTDDVRISLALDGTRNREASKPTTLLEVNPLADFAAFWNFAVNGATCFTPPAGLPIPDAPACFNDQWITGDAFTTVGGGPNYSDLDLWGIGATIEWVLPAATFKSISSYRDLQSAFYQDYDNSPLPIGETSNDYTQDQWSQEFQLSGVAASDRLTWLLGLYYLKETGRDENNLVFSIADFLSGGDVDNDSYAAFAQFTWQISDRLRMTPGLRYTRETKRFLPDQFIINDNTGGSLLALSQLFIPTGNPNGNLILPRVEESTKASELTPALSFDYRIAPDVLGYVSYAEGFKSGGFTQRVFPPEPVVPSFGPEFVKSYEIGLKTELFDRRLRLNTAVFYTDYTGLQIVVNEGVAPKVRNAGEATIRGLEVDLEAALHERVRLYGGAGYTDAEYDDVDPNAVGITAENDFPNVPEWNGTLGVSADLMRSDAGTLSARVDWSYRGAHFKDAVNSPQIRQGAYSLVNASVTYGAADDRWALVLGGTNLTDETYLVTGYQDLPVIGVATGTYARPREWFVGARYRF